VDPPCQSIMTPNVYMVSRLSPEPAPPGRHFRFFFVLRSSQGAEHSIDPNGIEVAENKGPGFPRAERPVTRSFR